MEWCCSRREFLVMFYFNYPVKTTKIRKWAEDAGKQKRTKHLQQRSSASAHCSPTLAEPLHPRTHTLTQAIKSKVFFVMWPMKLWLSERESLVFVYTISGVLNPSVNPLKFSIVLRTTREFPFSMSAFLQDRKAVQHWASTTSVHTPNVRTNRQN